MKLKGWKVKIRPLDIPVIARILSNNWEIIEASEVYLTLRNKEGITIKCRTVNSYDFGHIVEIYLDNVYKTYVKDKNVIDVGMSNGDSCIYFAKKGAKRVVGIEPDKSSYELALENIKNSNVDNLIIPINKALSSQTGQTNLIVYENAPNANSIDEENMVKMDGSRFYKPVETITLPAVLQIFENERIGLLKMDCEGCEYKVLNNLPENIYNQIEEIYLEYHNGLQNLKLLLEKMGFLVEFFGDGKYMGYLIAKRL